MGICRNLACLFVLTWLASGCAGQGIGTPPAGLTQPFSVQISGGEGLAAEMSGYTDGYRPGQQATIDVSLRNESNAEWESRYCLVLLDHDKTVAHLAQEEFSLRPGESEPHTVAIQLPDPLPDGSYGLALVVPSRFSTTVTIWAGESKPALAASKLPESISGGSGQNVQSGTNTWPEPGCP